MTIVSLRVKSNLLQMHSKAVAVARATGCGGSSNCPSLGKTLNVFRGLNAFVAAN